MLLKNGADLNRLNKKQLTPIDLDAAKYLIENYGKYITSKSIARFYPGSPLLEYADTCKNTLLKRTFEFMFLPEMSVLFLIFTLVWMHKKSAGYPIGGSLKFARLFEKKYLDSGGKINYRSKVTKILSENNVTQGIQLEDGTIHNSYIVISSADGNHTIFEMLE